jgi:hypothetical protein
MIRSLLTLVVLLLALPAHAFNVTEIIDAAGDGGGNTLSAAQGVAVDSSGNVYVAGISSSNAFKITPGGTITEIIDAAGDGGGNTLSAAQGVAVDSSDNVYVGGYGSHNAFKIQWVPPVPALSIGALIITTGLLGFTGWRRLHI